MPLSTEPTSLSLDTSLLQIFYSAVLKHNRTGAAPRLPPLCITDNDNEPENANPSLVPGYTPLPHLSSYLKTPPSYSLIDVDCNDSYSRRTYFIAPPIFAAPILHPDNLSHVPFLIPLDSWPYISFTDADLPSDSPILLKMFHTFKDVALTAAAGQLAPFPKTKDRNATWRTVLETWADNPEALIDPALESEVNNVLMNALQPVHLGIGRHKRAVDMVKEQSAKARDTAKAAWIPARVAL